MWGITERARGPAGARGWARSGHHKQPSNAGTGEVPVSQGGQVKQPHPAPEQAALTSPQPSPESKELSPAVIHHLQPLPRGTAGGRRSGQGENLCCRSCQCPASECPAAPALPGSGILTDLRSSKTRTFCLLLCWGFWVCFQRAVGRSQVPAGAPKALHWHVGSGPSAPHPSQEVLWAELCPGLGTAHGMCPEDRPEGAVGATGWLLLHKLPQ